MDKETETFVRKRKKVNDTWQMRKAAEIIASNHPSDPFAYGRAMAHMKQGVLEVSDVTTENKGKVAV